jgi:hypothetical protein
MSGSGTTTWRSKRPGPQQRRVEHVGPVGRGDHDHARVALEAVHLDEQLVERLLALVVAAAEARAALAADRVDLVDEHDARRVLLRLLEHVAHARGADADEHLDEVGARDREERHLRLAGDRLREQRLAGARRADHQHAARDAAAELLELRRVAQELDQLGDLLLRLVAARDVGERHRVVGLVEHARLALAEAERAAAARRPASGA